MLIKNNYCREIDLNDNERNAMSLVRSILITILTTMRRNGETLYVDCWDEYEEYDVKKLETLISQLEKFSTIKLIKESDDEL